MSENIQSISQGTYTLGDTNKLTFSAGPGIKIDEPSAGTVRIGNDETVLWDGNGTPVASANLSESISNFERVRVLLGPYSGANYSLEYYELSPSGRHIWNFSLGLGEANAWHAIVQLKETDDTLYSPVTKRMNFGAFTSTTTNITSLTETNPAVIFKVIGINRISGGNE